MRFGIDFGANLLPFWLDFCVLGVSWGALGPSWGRPGPPWRLHKRLDIFERFFLEPGTLSRARADTTTVRGPRHPI